MIGALWPGIADRRDAARLDAVRVYLRPPRAGDYAAWAELRAASRAFLVPWEPVWSESALSRANFRRRLRRQAEELRTGAGYAFFILRQEDDAILGGLNIGNLRRGVAQTATLGYWMGLPHARQGYMSEALGRIVTYGFDALGLHRLEAACLPHNEASRALLERAGFRPEGAARKYLCINGKWQDHLIYARLSEDRPAPR